MTIYSQTSPYFKTVLQPNYLDIMEFRNLPNQVDDILYEVDAKYNNRPDLLAFDVYGDSNLWWVFAVRNKDIIRDPIYDLVAGAQIFLPKLSTIKSEFGI